MSGGANPGVVRLRRNRVGNSRRVPSQMLIAPLIDIVFLLLIFFMLVTKFLSPSISVALPESDSGVIDDSPARTVSVDRDGNCWLDENPVTLEELTSELNELRRAGEIELVRLRLDADATSQMFVDTLDAITNAGISNVAIETENSREEAL